MLQNTVDANAGRTPGFESMSVALSFLALVVWTTRQILSRVNTRLIQKNERECEARGLPRIPQLGRLAGITCHEATSLPTTANSLGYWNMGDNSRLVSYKYPRPRRLVRPTRDDIHGTVGSRTRTPQITLFQNCPVYWGLLEAKLRTCLPRNTP